jgi:2-polyprenyl-3-methyl-5-hydroxy-6-metoxy-1,4-benzoquinol methylase
MVSGPARLTGVVERMDRPGVGEEDLRRTLMDLARINRTFGGTKIVLGHLRPWLSRLRQPIRMLDVGTGFADLPRAIVGWARREGIAVSIEGLDHHAEIRTLATQACADYPEIRIREGDALALPYPDQSFDIAFASQIIHHMEGEEPIRLLRELRRVARHDVLVSDLRRGTCPFLVTWVALHLVSGSPLIRHDGPLSIRRGFNPTEMLALANAAGWKTPRVFRHAFFRLALLDARATTDRDV